MRNYLRSRFPRRPWVDVVSKADLDIPQSTLDLMPAGALRVSVTTGTGVSDLKLKIECLMNELKQVLVARGAVESQEK